MTRLCFHNMSTRCQLSRVSCLLFGTLVLRKMYAVRCHGAESGDRQRTSFREKFVCPTPVTVGRWEDGKMKSTKIRLKRRPKGKIAFVWSGDTVFHTVGSLTGSRPDGDWRLRSRRFGLSVERIQNDNDNNY